MTNQPPTMADWQWLDSKQISYILGCIDVDLEKYATSYSQSQIDWIHELKAQLTTPKQPNNEERT